MKYAKQMDDGWHIEAVHGMGEVATAQIAVFEAQGYKPVRESARPDDTPFVIWSASYAESGDEVVENWWSAAIVIRLDRAKLVSAATEGGWLEGALAYFQSSPEAQNWWANNMTYVEDSPMAAAAMEALGLTLEQTHALVLQCRE